MAVRIRLKKLGRTHRPFFRVCAMDQRAPRDGRVIEELGTYDPMVPETDARAILRGDRISYWLSVGAQPSRKVATLIKKYGEGGTHLEAQAEAIGRLSSRRAASIEAARNAASKVEMPKSETPEKPAEEATPESPAEGEAAAEAPAAESDAPATEGASEAAAEAPAEETKKEASTEEASTEEASTEEASTEEASTEEKSE